MKPVKDMTMGELTAERDRLLEVFTFSPTDYETEIEEEYSKRVQYYNNLYKEAYSCIEANPVRALELMGEYLRDPECYLKSRAIKLVELLSGDVRNETNL